MGGAGTQHPLSQHSTSDTVTFSAHPSAVPAACRRRGYPRLSAGAASLGDGTRNRSPLLWVSGRRKNPHLQRGGGKPNGTAELFPFLFSHS